MRKNISFLMWIPSIIFFLAALVFFIIGSLSLYHNWKLDKYGVLTKGTVTNISSHTSSSSNNRSRTTSYRPTIRFSTPLGVFEEKYLMSSSVYDFAIGDSIEIKYNPDNPKDYQIVSKTNIIFGLMFTMGGIMFLGGAFLFIKLFPLWKSNFIKPKL